MPAPPNIDQGTYDLMRASGLSEAEIWQVAGYPMPGVAARCGLTLMASELAAECLIGLHLYYDATSPPDAQDAQIARCIARHALHRSGLPVSDSAVQFIADAIVRWASPAVDVARTTGALAGALLA